MYSIIMAHQKRCTMSLYIPVVFNHTTNSEMEKTFEVLDIGNVTKIDRIPVMRDEVDTDGNVQRKKSHDQAFVHLVWRTDSVAAMNLYDKLEVDGTSAKLVYNDPYYWAIYKNRNPEQSIIREQSARIKELESQMDDLTERVRTLESANPPDDSYMPIGRDGWARAIASPLWNMHENTRGVAGIESLEPWEGDHTPDPFFHNPYSPKQSPIPSPPVSPNSEELLC